MDFHGHSGNSSGPNNADQLVTVAERVVPISALVIIVICLVFLLWKMYIDNRDDLEHDEAAIGNNFRMHLMSRHSPNNSSRFSFKETEVHSV